MQSADDNNKQTNQKKEKKKKKRSKLYQWISSVGNEMKEMKEILFKQAGKELGSYVHKFT